MASASPFDDLLKEFDDDALGPRRPPEDPLRGENLQKLLALSKKLEGIAKTLDPSDAKHPLNGQTVPEAARIRLKALVGELMRVQEALHGIEKGLLEAQETEAAKQPTSHERPFDDLDRPPSPRERRRDPLDEDLLPPPRKRPPLDALDDLSPTQAQEKPSQEERAPFPFAETNPLPTKSAEASAPTPLATEPPAEPPMPVPPAPPALTPDHLHLEQEKQAFEAYKASWEHVFATDPSQRNAHPEVQQYYDQMEAYFKEKMAYISSKNQQP